MPRVPDSPSIQTSIAPDSPARFTPPSGPAPGAIAGQQASNFGAASLDAGDATLRMATDMADQANQVRVNDAINRVRMAAQDLAYNPQSGFLQRKGSQAFLDDTGKPLETPLPQEYGGKLNDTIGDVSGSLANDRQRQLFQQQASGIATQFHGQVEQHLVGQFNAYKDATDDATVKLAGQTAALSWNDPDALFGKLGADGTRSGGAIDQAKAAIYEKARRAGLTGAAYDEAVLAGVSAIHTNVITGALDNHNPTYALNYLDQARKRGEMSGTDILRMQGHLNLAVDQQTAEAAVQAATSSVLPKVAPTGFDRMLQITAKAESGGHETNPDGSTVTSPAGAQGVMQVMPATNKDPGFGVKPAADDSPAERARVGRDYLQAMLQRYGDPAKAWAAYNAGPGAVDKALTEADKDAKTGAFRTGVPADLWLSKLPDETQNYVKANTAELAKNGGPLQRPTELDFVTQAVGQLPAGAAITTVQATRERAKAQFEMLTKTLNEKGDNAVRAAQQWLATNKGSTVSQMPSAITDDLNRYAPDKVDDINKYSIALQHGDVATNLGRYNDIVTHMDQYATMSDTAWSNLQTELNPRAFEQLTQERQAYINGGRNAAPGSLNIPAINRALDAGLQSLKIPTAVPKTDLAGQERLGGIRSFVNDSIHTAQNNLGRKMTDDEITTHIHKLFATDVPFQNTVFGFNTGTGSAKLMGMQIGDLPSDAKQGLTKALISSGNKAPTDTDVLNLYRRLHAAK